MLKNFISKHFSKNRGVMDYLPPTVNYERSYWYDRRWDVMSNKDEKDPNSHAVPTLCLWCGKITPAYPLRELGGGTNCHECDRTVDESYLDWVYRAEFKDGCYYTLDKSGRSSSGGPSHAPHSAFQNDHPVFEMVNPLLPSEQCEKLLSFFRECYQDAGYGKHDPENPIWGVVESMPQREYPHRYVAWVNTERNKPFSGDILTAPIEKYLIECKDRDTSSAPSELRKYKTFQDAWNISPDANWMAHLLEVLYRREVFGDRKALAAMVECCELVLEDARNPLLIAFISDGIMPSLRGSIYTKITKRDDCNVITHCDPSIGDQLDYDARARLLTYARAVYYCHRGLGGMNENNSEQRVVDSIRYAIEESLTSHYEPNFGLVLASVCNNFYGSALPKKDRMEKCAAILRKHFPAEFISERMTGYKLRGNHPGDVEYC